VEQLERFHLDPTAKTTLPIGAQVFRKALVQAREERQKLEGFTVETIRDAEEKARLLAKAKAATDKIKVVADLIVGAALATAGKKATALEAELKELGPLVSAAFDEKASQEKREERYKALRRRAEEMLGEGRRPSTGCWSSRRCSSRQRIRREGSRRSWGIRRFKGGSSLAGRLARIIESTSCNISQPT
jgi:hypothetical protein